jgi:LacI family transcriptional regulator
MAIQLPRVILLLETSRAYGRGLLYGIAKYSKLHGPWAFYREPRGLKTAIPYLQNWSASGIIMRNSVISKQMIELNLPTIMVLHESERHPHLPVVSTDSEKISKLAAEHLLNRGFRNFAFCGFNELAWSDTRGEYFNKLINDAGFNVDTYYCPKSSRYKSWQNEQERMSEWLKSLPKPLGIMACNDDRGQHVLEACKIAGLTVPEQVAVIGVDNDALICDLCDPPLTSIVLNTEQAGYVSAELLDRLMHGEKMEGQEIIATATHVNRRQSTDILAINDDEVVSAIRFIKNNAKEKFSVNEVVNSTSVGRRRLETRFQKILNRSIQQEIRRVRVELIEQMLFSTDLSISEITSQFNFADVEHISRYFKKEKAMSLREYRKLFRRC